MSKLNLGCGATKLPDYVNVDSDPALLPDVVLDISKQIFPWSNGTIDEILMSHTIEHITRDSHIFLIAEINRVMKIGGKLFISYPEFGKCAANLMENKWGQRIFWELTIYGRGLTVGDMHRCAMISDDFVPFLREHGFGKIRRMEEANSTYNSFIEAEKTFSLVNMEETIRKEILAKI